MAVSDLVGALAIRSPGLDSEQGGEGVGAGFLQGLATGGKLRGNAQRVLSLLQRVEQHGELRGVVVGDEPHRLGRAARLGEEYAVGGVVARYLDVYPVDDKVAGGGDQAVGLLRHRVVHVVDDDAPGGRAGHDLDGGQRLPQGLAHGEGYVQLMYIGIEGGFLALEGPYHVGQELSDAVHVAFALGQGLYFLVIAHVEDVDDRLEPVLGAFVHDPPGEVGVAQGAGDGYLAAAIAFLLGEVVVVKIDVQDAVLLIFFSHFVCFL